MRKLVVGDCNHLELLYPHEHPHINRNTKYTIRCSECGREGFYHRMCPTLREINHQNVVQEIINRSAFFVDEYQTWHNILITSDDDVSLLCELFDCIGDDNRVYICRHKCGKCDKHSLYVIQNW